MKWNHKGKEFEQIGRLFQARNRRIYIYGAGEFGKDLYAKLFLLKDKITFVDLNEKKQKDGYCGCTVISPWKLLATDINDSIVVLAMSEYNVSELRRVLVKKGWVENQDFFSYHSFCNLYLPIYLCYTSHISYIQEITLLITEKCTLRCKHCAGSYPCFIKPENNNFERVKEDVDVLFSKLDYIWKLVVTGGEPFLHPDFFRIVTYIEENYKDKYNHIHIVTNATICPNVETIKYMVAHNFRISVSDYLPFLTNEVTKGKIRETLRRFDEYEVDYFLVENAKWVDFGFADNYKKATKKEVDLVDYFDCCNATCRGFFNKHFVFCTPAFTSAVALNKKGYEELDSDNYYMTDSKMELLEWLLGYSEKGYLDMCRVCNGHVNMNQNVVTPAIQME